MKIAVVDLVSVNGGGYTITKSLYDYISAGKAPQHQWVFIVAGQSFQSNRYVTVLQLPQARKGYFQRLRTEIFNVNKILKSQQVELVIAMSNMRVLGVRLPQIVYLQQSLPFQTEKKFSFLCTAERSYAFRQYLQGTLIKYLIRKAKAVAVQTQWMNKAVSLAVPNVPVWNIGFPQENKDSKIPQVTAFPKDFFYPAGPAIYKNFGILAEAASLLKKQGYTFKIYLTLTKKELAKLIAPLPLDINIFYCMGRIPLEQVKQLYAKHILVFPSYIETLGLPLQEARDAGTWIIASDCAFSHEILDDYTNKSFFNPHQAQSLAGQMKKVLDREVTLMSSSSPTVRRENCWDKLVSQITRFTQEHV